MIIIKSIYPWNPDSVPCPNRNQILDSCFVTQTKTTTTTTKTSALSSSNLQSSQCLIYYHVLNTLPLNPWPPAWPPCPKIQTQTAAWNHRKLLSAAASAPVCPACQKGWGQACRCDYPPATWGGVCLTFAFDSGGTRGVQERGLPLQSELINTWIHLSEFLTGSSLLHMSTDCTTDDI